MAELIARTPCQGLLPLEIGEMILRETDAGFLTSVAPFIGQHEGAAEVLKSAHGLAWPKPNRATGKDGGRAIWFSRGQILLMGPKPDKALGKASALTDQSDAWAVTRLDGVRSVDVLARLVPVDLRATQFKRGHTLRSQLMHMPVSITRVGEAGFQIMVFRSMAATLVHEMKSAMEAVTARG